MTFTPGPAELGSTYWLVSRIIDKAYRRGRVNGKTKQEFFDSTKLEDVVAEPVLKIFSDDPASVLRAAADAGIWVDTCWWGERVGTHYRPKVKYGQEWIDMPEELIPHFDRQGKYRTREQVTPCNTCEDHYKHQIAEMRQRYGNNRHDDIKEDRNAA